MEGMYELYEQIKRDAAPVIQEVGGRLYSREKMFPVDEPPIETIDVTTLAAISSYIKSSIDTDAALGGRPFIHIVDPTTVRLVSHLRGDFMRRSIIMEAKATLPVFRFNTYTPAEEFNIGVQSTFVPNEGRALVLACASSVKGIAENAISDDGMTQTVNAKVGVQTKTGPLPNPVLLAPYRTFAEVAQPESEFIFRVSKDLEFMLKEGDGGVWRLAAMKNIYEYFRSDSELNDVDVLY